jgi:hypothetical protein
MAHQVVSVIPKLFYAMFKFQELLEDIQRHANSSREQMFNIKVQCSLYSAQHPGYKHEDILQRTMARAHHHQARITKLGNTNNYKI